MMINMNRQTGMSLIELMIASALGLIISLFIINIMTNSSRTSMTSGGIAEAQENGRFVISWLQERIQMAGYKGNFKNRPSEKFFGDICAGLTQIPPTTNAHCTFEDNNNTVAGGDRIAVRRYLNHDSGKIPAPVPATPAIYGQACDGTSLTALVSGTELIDIFWVDRNIASITDDSYDDVLYCITYDGTTGEPALGMGRQIVANGVEALQVLYLLDSRDQKVTSYPNIAGLRYVSADLVTNWENVSAAKIAVLTRAFDNNSLEKKKRSYVLLDAAPYTEDDTIARYIQQTTVYLPNKDFID